MILLHLIKGLWNLALRFVHQDLNVFYVRYEIIVQHFMKEGKKSFLLKRRKKQGKVVPVASFAIQNAKGEWLLRKRPEKGLLANLWEFPMVELTDDKTPEE